MWSVTRGGSTAAQQNGVFAHELLNVACIEPGAFEQPLSDWRAVLSDL
jgi:hypothetical protein